MFNNDGCCVVKPVGGLWCSLGEAVLQWHVKDVVIDVGELVSCAILTADAFS